MNVPLDFTENETVKKLLIILYDYFAIGNDRHAYETYLEIEKVMRSQYSYIPDIVYLPWIKQKLKEYYIKHNELPTFSKCAHVNID